MDEKRQAITRDLDLRLSELQRKEAYRIFNKSNDDHTKLMLTKSRPPLNSNESPAYHLKRLYNNTLRFINANYGNATPEEIVAPLNHYERPEIQCHNLDRKWGNASNRTSTQKEQCSTIISKQLELLQEHSNIIAFTDGSTIGNPGPTGASGCCLSKWSCFNSNCQAVH